METKLTKEEQSEIKQERERGASLVEYAILTALMAGIAIIAVNLMGSSLNNAFNTISADVNQAAAR